VQRRTLVEAAEVLECSVKTVSARLARAREFFTNRIARYLDVDDKPGTAAGS
jgi:DNA-directed RNA polymerase specialized sigma24 family protein